MLEEQEEAGPLILSDALGREREGWCLPYLVFDKTEGRLTIADDYETMNDVTARDFVLTKDDALQLASRLIDYVRNGTTSTTQCVSQEDVKSFLDGQTAAA